MTYNPHFRLSFGGTFFSTEQWSMSLRISGGNLVNAAARENFAGNNIEAAKNAVVAWWSAPNCGANRAAILEYVKLNPIGTNGKYESQETYSLAAGNVQPATFSPGLGNHLPQISLVLSLRSGLRNGRGAFGRVFMPPQIMTMTSSASPFIEAASVARVANAFKDFIADLNDWPGVDVGWPKVSIESPGEGSAPGISQDVTSVRVGNLFDTHRSRRDQLKETYTLVDL